MDIERVKGLGPCASIAVTLLISALFTLTFYQILSEDEDEITPQTPRTAGLLFEIDRINQRNETNQKNEIDQMNQINEDSQTNQIE